jgi:hypothetical protein
VEFSGVWEGILEAVGVAADLLAGAGYELGEAHVITQL